MDKNNSSRPGSKRLSDPMNAGGNKSAFSGGKRDTSPAEPMTQPEAEEPMDDLDDSGLLVDKQLMQYMPDEQDPRRQPKPTSSPVHKP